jgi:hypothetical protein
MCWYRSGSRCQAEKRVLVEHPVCQALVIKNYFSLFPSLKVMDFCSDVKADHLHQYLIVFYF